MANQKIKKIINALSEGTESVRTNPSPENYRVQENKLEQAGKSSNGTIFIILGIVLFIFICGFAIISGAAAAVFSNSSTNGLSDNQNEYVYQQPTEYIAPQAYIYPTEPPVVTRQFATISSEVSEVNLRRSSGYQGKNDNRDVIVKVPTGARVEILGATEYTDELTWWYISWGGYEGWMADHTGSGKTILLFE